MNREIEFRGKAFTELTDKWVYGNLLLSETPVSEQPKAFIVTRFAYSENVAKIEVDPSTVGQFTGLRDKYRKRIYEGDIVNLSYNSNYSGKSIYCELTYIVKFDIHKHSSSFNLDIIDKTRKRHDLSYNERLYVIGNIHDNPELLNKEK